ncbi:MAG: aspartate 1-decarboxylase [Armatimonadetes bacterium]|nr:aspartate 1-decarboxylase [Armatimonadota bacterium]
MLRHMAKSKIHGATVTQTELHYTGSITLSPALMQAADLLADERVQVVNMANGARLETYVIEGEEGSDTVCLNGPAARMAAVGDKIHVISYALYEDSEARVTRMKTVMVDEHNQPRSEA